MNPRCNHCGRFYRYEDGDQYTHFGGAADLEPPDPIFMCPACSKRDEDEQVARGYPDDAWMHSQSQRNAAKRLGFIAIAPRGAGWTQWHKASEPLPEGYERVGSAEEATRAA